MRSYVYVYELSVWQLHTLLSLCNLQSIDLAHRLSIDLDSMLQIPSLEPNNSFCIAQGRSAEAINSAQASPPGHCPLGRAAGMRTQSNAWPSGKRLPAQT